MREPSKENAQKSAGLCELCECGALWDMVDMYLGECREQLPSEQTRKAKAAVRFPNLAGLCRFVNVGMSQLALLCERCPEDYDRLLAIFDAEGGCCRFN